MIRDSDSRELRSSPTQSDTAPEGTAIDAAERWVANSSTDSAEAGGVDGSSAVDVDVAAGFETPFASAGAGGEPPAHPSDALPPESPKKEKKNKNVKKKAGKESGGRDKPGSAGKAGGGRSTETLFRIVYRTHMDLSSLADTKANIMISITGIAISILLAGMSGALESRPHLLLPGGVMLLGAILAMIFAVQAARPRVSNPVVTKADADADRTNVLFFGTFNRLTSPDFVDVMMRLIDDSDRVHASLLRDLHQLGGVLERKFRLLRTAYTIFMWSVAIGAVLFFVALGAPTGWFQ